MKTVILAALCAVLCVSSAEARPKKHHRPAVQADCGFFFCDFITTQNTNKIGHKSRFSRQFSTTPRGRILAHPHGCPRRAFCGCGASIRVFGRSIRKLWLARNWFSFPRTSPAPGMVAVRRHHVFVLERHLGGSTWLAYDANSGRGLTRLHPRSIAGYAIVNPHGAVASRGQAL